MSIQDKLVDEFSRTHAMDRILQAIAEESIEAAREAMRMLRKSKGATSEELIGELVDVHLMTTIFLRLSGVSENEFEALACAKAEKILSKIQGGE